MIILSDKELLEELCCVLGTGVPYPIAKSRIQEEHKLKDGHLEDLYDNYCCSQQEPLDDRYR